MKSKLLIGLFVLTISNNVLAQVAQKLGVTTDAERSTVLCLFNCKSEVDKCVDARIRQVCAGLFPDMKEPEKGNLHSKEYPPLLCGDFVLNTSGGSVREQCLRAASGNNK
jgi:hypothetical protein